MYTKNCFSYGSKNVYRKRGKRVSLYSGIPYNIISEAAVEYTVCGMKTPSYISRAGGTAQRSRQLPRAADILGRQIVSGEKKEGKSEKIEESEKRKERDKER